MSLELAKLLIKDMDINISELSDEEIIKKAINLSQEWIDRA